MLRKKLPFTLEAIENNIFDIAGIRVVCSFVDDIYMLRRLPAAAGRYHADRAQEITSKIRRKTAIAACI
ncbi:MAG: hypothetical protein ACLU3U_02620 [Gallintestinimicrobium sp.]